MRSRTSASLALAVAATLGAAAWPSCVLELSDGHEATLRVRGRTGEASSLDGITITLEQAWLHVGGAELVACAGEPEARREARALGPSVARAHHGAGDGRAIGGAHAVALHGPAHTLGVFRPGPGRYCAVRLVVTPAGSAAHGLPDPAMIGWTLFARGHEGERPRELSAYSNGAWDVALREPLEVGEAPARAALDVHLDVPDALARVPLAPDADPLGIDLLRALAATARAEVQLAE